MGISAINGQSLYSGYEQLSSGKRINSAADDAAGLSIANKLESQGTTLDVGTSNAATSQNMINVADGALASIGDSLQRIRELSIQASNTAVYGESEIGSMQSEINHLKEHISDVAKNTQFNTKNLLDGSMTSSKVAVNSDGNGLDIDMPTSTLEALGIADYDVTGTFDISDIDKAIEAVSTARGNLGAASNRLDSVMAYNSYASYNTIASQSRIEDLDFPKAISDMEKQRVLEEYQLMMQQKKQEEEKQKLGLLKF